MLKPVIPAFYMPTIKAPRTAHIHCSGSAIMVGSLPRAATVSPNRPSGYSNSGGSFVGVELAQSMQVDDDVVALVDR